MCAHTCARVYTCVHVCAHVYVCMRVPVCMCVHMRVHVRARAHVRVWFPSISPGFSLLLAGHGRLIDGMEDAA